MEKCKTTVMQAEGSDATGVIVPDHVVTKLGAGKKPKVTVTLKGYTYRNTIFFMGGQYMVPLAKEHREKTGVEAGDKVEVTLELDIAPRVVEVPKDLAAALKKAGVRAAFDGLSFTYRKEHVRAIPAARGAGVGVLGMWA